MKTWTSNFEIILAMLILFLHLLIVVDMLNCI